MLFRHITIVALSSLLSVSALADRNATGDDGRKIILKQDGSWEYANTDRYATSEDGTRVRLKDDGQWEFIGNAPVKTEQQFREESLDINLSQVITEFAKSKVPGSKNTRIRSNTIFSLNVDISSYSDTPITADINDFRGLTVSDNRGNEYDVIAVTPQKQQLEPGSKYAYEIRVDGSPKFNVGFFNIKTITLNIDAAVFRTNSDISLSLDADEILQRRVSKL
ncbi:hypothetical protein R50073_48120 [Maricurvus nonylphenolicus]|uniref:hypothetical protein n=1 Tax=Maricurvus nonylphenolicus TaxID=1008307 RepID=UPI0036F29888